jgi:hypothetical protein
MDNHEYQEKYRQEYAKAQERARQQYAQSFINDRLTLQQIKLFNAGNQAPAMNRRQYRAQFTVRSLKTLYVEVSLAHPQPKERVNFVIHFSVLANGKEFHSWDMNSYADTGWTNSIHTSSGLSTTNWERGIYTVEIRVNGRLMGKQTFSVA